MKYVRENTEKEFDQFFNQVEGMVIKHGVQPTLPRRIARQKHRNNVPTEKKEVIF